MPAASPFALTLSLLTAAVVGFGAGALIALGDDGEDDPVATSTATPGATSSTTPAPAPAPSSSTAAPSPPAQGGPVTVLLAADASAVPPNQRINLAGQLQPAVEGVVLVVQRSIDGGEWQDFSGVTATTGADGTFATYVQTQRAGANAFRVVGDAAGTQVTSEPVTITVG